jgi:hypothetical protein
MYLARNAVVNGLFIQVLLANCQAFDLGNAPFRLVAEELRDSVRERAGSHA